MRIAWIGFQSWVETEKAEIKDEISSAMESIAEYSSDINALNHGKTMHILLAYSKVSTAFKEYLEY